MKLFVSCGSKLGNDPCFAKVTSELGDAMMSYDVQLVYGGSDRGLMGVIADKFIAGKKTIIATSIEQFVNDEGIHHGVQELKLFDSLEERKNYMINVSDGIIILPGGLGTVDELFTALTQNHIYGLSKPCFILNINGYYDDLIRFLKKGLENNFIANNISEFLFIEDSVEKLIDKIVQFLYIQVS